MYVYTTTFDQSNEYSRFKFVFETFLQHLIMFVCLFVLKRATDCMLVVGMYSCLEFFLVLQTSPLFLWQSSVLYFFYYYFSYSFV